MAASETTSTRELFASQFSGPKWPDLFGEWLSEWSSEALPRKIRTLSLFTGAGGLDIGFHQAGFHAVEMIEFDHRFVSTLEANAGMYGLFRRSIPRHEDVRNYDPRHLGPIDFIIGGPPCQSFSAAGRRAGGVRGTSDDRGQLFRTYVDLLKQLKPVGFLFENVYGITGANDGKDWDAICTSFSEAGYLIHHRILDAADYGVPQHRERMFIVGLKRGSFKFPRPTHGPDSTGRPLYFDAKTAISDMMIDQADATGVNGRYGHLLAEIPPGLNYSFFTERMGHPQPVFAWRSKFSDFLYKANPHHPVRTIKAQGGQYTGPFHWDNRPFSIAELKRLQTFPDDYHIVGGRSAVIQQIGNSVPPQIARIIALAILEQVFKVPSPVRLDYLAPDETLGFRARKREITHYYERTAKKHLQQRKQPKVTAIRARSTCVKLTDDFRISEDLRDAKYAYRIHSEPLKNYWRIKVDAVHAPRAVNSFSVVLQPRENNTWPLPCHSVELKGSALHEEVFTVAWKFFEVELQRYRIKADLIQLSGYYQYEPAFNSRMEMVGRVPWKWRALAKAVNGNGLRETRSAGAIASVWGIKPERLPEFGEFLRSLGMEIRNHNTNPQIPEGHWMLPYAFPTLNHQSVQLNKGLSK